MSFHSFRVLLLSAAVAFLPSIVAQEETLGVYDKNMKDWAPASSRVLTALPKKKKLKKCTADQFLNVGNRLERALMKANLPTTDLYGLLSYVMENDDSPFIWNSHRVTKESSLECSQARPLKVVWISPSTWCMNLGSMPQRRSRAGTRSLTEDPAVKAVEIDGKHITASTCVVPGGSYNTTCASISISPIPNMDGICNMAAICQEEVSSTTYTIWNKGTWPSKSVPSLSTNANGCLSSGDDAWSRNLCKSTPAECATSPPLPNNCKLAYYSLHASQICSIMVRCTNDAGSTYTTIAMYSSQRKPANLYVNATNCLVADGGWAVKKCGLGCGVPSGSYTQDSSCYSTLVTPFAANGVCSMSTACNWVSNRGTFSAIGPPPSLSVNEDNCIAGDDKWAREFCGTQKCAEPPGSYTTNCQIRHYVGPSINNDCYMTMTCLTDGGYTQNTVAYNYNSDIDSVEFSLNKHGCLTSQDLSVWWSRTSCTFTKHPLPRWFGWAMLAAVLVVAAVSCAVGCEGAVAVEPVADAAVAEGEAAAAEESFAITTDLASEGDMSISSVGIDSIESEIESDIEVESSQLVDNVENELDTILEDPEEYESSIEIRASTRSVDEGVVWSVPS